MKTLILFIAIFAVSALAQDTCNADIKWRNCPRKARNCDACFIAVFSYQGGSRKERDIMCMKSTSPNACIYTGNMLSDKSFAVVTGKNGKCTPFSEDPLEVSLSGERCTGSWVVENGKTQRPARPAFGPGTVDEVLEVPEGVVTSLNGRPVQNRPVPRPQKPVLAIN